MSLQSDKYLMDMQLEEAVANLAAVQDKIKSNEDRASAAQEIEKHALSVLARIDPATARIAGPPREVSFEDERTARYDLELAQKTLATCAEKRARLSQLLEQGQAVVTAWQTRKRQFPMAQLQEELRLEELRRRCQRRA